MPKATAKSRQDEYWDIEAECLPTSELATKQITKLNRTIQHAQTNSPFYIKKYAGASYKELKSLGDITQLPFTSKDELTAAATFDLVAVPHTDLREVHLSSGTTSRPSPSFMSA